MKYSIKNLKLDIDYKVKEQEHAICDFNIEQIDIELDKGEFSTAYDAIRGIINDVVTAIKEVRQSELQSQTTKSFNNQYRPHKCGKRDREVFTKK